MKKGCTGWIISIAVMAAAVMVAQAQGPGGFGRGGDMRERMHGKMGGGDRLIEMLDLDEEQAEAVRDLSYEHRKKMIEYRADQELLELELEQLMSDEGADREEILGIVEEIGEVRTKIEKVNVSHRLDVQEIVGEEKLDELREKMKERASEFMKNRGDRGKHNPGDRGTRGKRGGRGRADKESEPSPEE